MKPNLRLLQLLLLCVLLYTSWEYSILTFDAPDTYANANTIVFGLEKRPFVYRALIPLTARLLVNAGVPAVLALRLIVMVSTVVMFYAFIYLLAPYLREELHRLFLSAVAVQLFMTLFFVESHPYDITTAAFFTFFLGFLAREQFAAFYVMFPLACLNRETAFLMTLVYIVYCLKQHHSNWIPGFIYQIFIYSIIHIGVMYIYASNPGSNAWFRPIENLQLYITQPWNTVIYGSLFTVTLWLCLRKWKQKPVVLRIAFVVMAPLLFVLYTFFGWTFEIRVFAELYPAAFALAV